MHDEEAVTPVEDVTAEDGTLSMPSLRLGRSEPRPGHIGPLIGGVDVPRLTSREMDHRRLAPESVVQCSKDAAKGRACAGDSVAGHVP
jgi:hypothetical protein